MPQKARSVPWARATLYCSGVSRALHSSSIFTTRATLIGSVKVPSACNKRTRIFSGSVFMGLVCSWRVLFVAKTTIVPMVRAARTSNRIVAGFIGNAFPEYVVFAGDSLQDSPKPDASSDFSVADASTCLSSGGHTEYLEAIVAGKRGGSPLL